MNLKKFGTINRFMSVDHTVRIVSINSNHTAGDTMSNISISKEEGKRKLQKLKTKAHLSIRNENFEKVQLIEEDDDNTMKLL